VNVLLIAAGAAPAGPVADALRQVDGVGRVELVTVPEPAGRAELDPVLDRLAGRRLVLTGSPAALGDLLVRLLCRDQVNTTPVGVIGPRGVWTGAAPAGRMHRAVNAADAGAAEPGAAEPGAAGARGGGRGRAGAGWPERLGVGGEVAEAARLAVTGVPRPVDLVRDDHGGVLVDRAEFEAWRGRRLGMRGYVDDVAVADGEVAGLSVMVTGGGTLVGQARSRRRWRPDRVRSAEGRAAQVSCAEARLVVDGRAHPRPVTRRNWWVEPGGWLVPGRR
jgi:hypothetical protein